MPGKGGGVLRPPVATRGGVRSYMNETIARACFRRIGITMGHNSLFDKHLTEQPDRYNLIENMAVDEYPPQEHLAEALQC